jgi:integrase
MQGHIHKRVHTCKDGRQTTRWYVVLDLEPAPEGRRRQKWHGGFRSRREAEVVRARLVNDLHHNRYVPPARLTLGEWVRNSWLPMIEMRIKPTTLRGYRQTMEQHVLPVIGYRPIQKLTPRELDALYAVLARGDRNRRPLSLGTVSNIHRTVHKALADAVDGGIVIDNAADRAKAPRPSRVLSRRVAAWQPFELAEFLTGIRGDRLEAIWRMAAMTGMRRGEILGLRWTDIDLERARLSVRRTLVDVNYRVLESTTKGNTARTIDLDARTVELLQAHRQTQDRERKLWGDAYEDSDVVVAWENGSSIHPHALSRMFNSRLRELGLRVIRLHDLRHTHATLALQVGVPVAVVSERLGHHSPAFTLAQYAHALPGMQAAAAAAVAELVVNEAGTVTRAHSRHEGRLGVEPPDNGSQGSTGRESTAVSGQISWPAPRPVALQPDGRCSQPAGERHSPAQSGSSPPAGPDEDSQRR